MDRRIGRPPKYANDEERRAADAERKRLARQARADVDPELPVADVNAEPEIEDPSSSPRESLPGLPSLDQYVADALLAAEMHHAATSSLATLSTVSLAETIERAEGYARWRYAGFLAGEINGL